MKLVNLFVELSVSTESGWLKLWMKLVDGLFLLL